MEIAIVFLSGFLLTSIIVNIVQLYKGKDKDEDYSKLSLKYSDLITSTKSAYQNTKKRRGVIEDLTISLVEDNGSSHKYTYDLHIIEIEKYQNGYSRFELDHVNVTNGFSPQQYDWIKESARSRFCEVFDPNVGNVVWLDPVDDIMEDRENKLKRILLLHGEDV